MQEPPRTLVRASTPRGEIALRERGSGTDVVHELIVAGVFTMDSVDTSSEVLLARRCLAEVEQPRRVLVGGLGLGYTAVEVLKDRRVERVDIVEIEEDLVLWARMGLTPTLGLVGRHPRAHLWTGDIAGVLQGGVPEPAGPWDVVLLDVDNGPSALVHAANAGLYAQEALAGALRQVATGGVLAIWSAQREPELLTTLRRLAVTQEVIVPVAREGRQFDYDIYLARP